jgi:hypothetical protein
VVSYRQVVVSVMSHHVRGRVVGSTVRPPPGELSLLMLASASARADTNMAPRDKSADQWLGPAIPWTVCRARSRCPGETSQLPLIITCPDTFARLRGRAIR